MVKLNEIRVDTDAAQAGVWIDWLYGIRLQVASASGPKYDAAYHRKVLPALLRLPSKKRTEAALDLSLEVVARHCLVGWENIEDDETGEPIPYSPAKAVELCKLSRPLYEAVYAQAVDKTNYLAGTLAAEAEDDEPGDAPEEESAEGN